MNNYKTNDAVPSGQVKALKRPRWGNRYGRLKVDEVIRVLALTSSIDKATQETGVAARTIRHWLQADTAFKEQLRLAKREIFEPGYAELRVEFPKTVRALVEMRDNPNVSDAVRLGAMRTLMEYGQQVDMTDHYDGKLEELEAKTINAVVDTTDNSTNDNNDGWINRTPDWKDQPQDWQQ